MQPSRAASSSVVGGSDADLQQLSSEEVIALSSFSSKAGIARITVAEQERSKNNNNDSSQTKLPLVDEEKEHDENQGGSSVDLVSLPSDTVQGTETADNTQTLPSRQRARKRNLSFVVGVLWWYCYCCYVVVGAVLAVTLVLRVTSKESLFTAQRAELVLKRRRRHGVPGAFRCVTQLIQRQSAVPRVPR